MEKKFIKDIDVEFIKEFMENPDVKAHLAERGWYFDYEEFALFTKAD